MRKWNETVGIFLSSMSAHTVRIAWQLCSYEEKYAAIKMELPLRVYIPYEVRSIIRFLWSAGWKKTEICEQVKEVYGETCMSLVVLWKLLKQFAERRTDVHNLQRGGWLLYSMSLNNVQRLLNLLEDRCMTILELCFHLQAMDWGRSSVHKIVHNVLGFQKLSIRFLSHLLIDEHMKNRVETTLSFMSA